MALPEHVRKRKAEIKELEKLMMGNYEAPASESTPSPDESTSETTTTSEVKPQKNPVEQTSAEAQPPAATSDEQHDKPVELPSPLKPDEDAIKRAEAEIHRNRVLGGRHNALQRENVKLKRELEEARNAAPPSQSDEVKKLSELVKTLQDQLAESRATVNVSAPADVSQQPTESIAEPQYITQMRAQVGDELANAALSDWQKSQQEAMQVSTQVSQLKASIDQMTEKEKSDAEFNKNVQALTSHLASQGINFHQVESDPEFKVWAQYQDPIYGNKKYYDLVLDNLESGNIEGAAAIFQLYAQTKTMPVPETPAAQSLESHVTQSPSSVQEDKSMVNEKAVVTPEQIDAFYAQMSKKKADAKRINDWPELERLQLEQKKFEAQLNI
ncbi:hypothetical protein [Agarilytica rhodophyticola]|uniref:hypothetical protein n=1 Tax=Agarilytica rhodophyticola TaxID=1737490 RepID=UPI000B34857C|nr:hypothetical protein [Agarilytica rhodophyticola]